MNRIQQLRLSAGLSQSQLADKSGINIHTLRQYEQGKRDIGGIGIRRARDLSRALGVQIEDLLED